MAFDLVKCINEIMRIWGVKPEGKEITFDDAQNT